MASAFNTKTYSIHSIWRSRLSSAARTALACALVGVATLYSPAPIHRHLKFPAFSYVTAVLIVGDATLGDALKGAACALYGSALGLVPAMLSLYIMQPREVSAATVGVAVGISSFVVVSLGWSSGLVTKRIALGQIVIVYVKAYEEGGGARLQPVPVAASTAVGAVAAVVALLLPFPRLAYWQVNEKSSLYRETAMQRLRLLVNGICADSIPCMASWASQAKHLSNLCPKLLHNIKLIQGSMKWEKNFFKLLSSHNKEPLDTPQAIEIPLKGMELALASTTSSHHKILDQQLKHGLITHTNQISIKLSQNCPSTLQPFDLLTPPNLRNLPFLFFLFCVTLFDNASESAPRSYSKVAPAIEEDSAEFYIIEKDEPARKGTMRPIKISKKTCIVALKCSLSLTLAVLLGIVFCKENGYWSGLAVAIAFDPSTNSTFRSASVRAHGTSLGSVYGVIGSFIAQQYMEVRLVLILPWIIFTSFLHRSRMYGQIGSFAATKSALIILGRKNYGSPMIFAVQRLIETYIGLFCAILFELILQPKRASTLARAQLCESLAVLRNCLDSSAKPSELKEKQKKLKKRVSKLNKFIKEAELEPNFWFLPFPIACYNKLHRSLSKIADLLEFVVLAQESHEMNEAMIKADLDQFRELVVSLIKCFEDAIQIKSLATNSNDIELGRGPRHCFDTEEIEKIHDSFVKNAEEVIERLDESSSEELKRKIVLCLGTFGFCIEGIMREVKRLEEGTLELLQWENPASHINLYEFFCKLK